MLRRVLGRTTGTETAPAAPGPAPGAPPGQGSILEQATPADRAILERTMQLTMTGLPRLQSLIDAVRHLVATEVPGAMAECGVWRGGSILAMILTLQDLGVADRDVYLYDTFEGMPQPSEADVSTFDPPALETWQEADAAGERPWPGMFADELVNEDVVRANVLSSGYPEERVHFVRGLVEETIPAHVPERIALLRLDTDWYESTRHEMIHLYPRLSPGGVLIVDDYGHWQGSRQAVDEHFAAHPPAPLLHRVDYSARLAVKPASAGA